jgi:hypothetical protein
VPASGLGGAHACAEHTFALIVQSVQAAPPEPQAVSAAPTTQVPFASQQPKSQTSGVHGSQEGPVQAPLPLGHPASQTTPAAPPTRAAVHAL